MDIKKEVGQRIKNCRKDLRLTQEQVATKLGVVTQQYQTYENGRYELNYQQLIKLCEILDTSADYLLGIKQEY